jgi:hypothetical protein
MENSAMRLSGGSLFPDLLPFSLVGYFQVKIMIRMLSILMLCADDITEEEAKSMTNAALVETVSLELASVKAQLYEGINTIFS